MAANNDVDVGLLTHVADFILDELSPNDSFAHDMKRRLRRWMAGYINRDTDMTLEDSLPPPSAGAAVGDKRRASAADASASKRQRGDDDDGDNPAEPDAPKRRGRPPKDKGPKKPPRAVNPHTTFITYGSKCIPEAWMDKVKAHVPTGRSMNLIQAYKQQLDSHLLEQFKDDVAPIIEEVNADPERVSGDSHKLVALLKARDEEAGAKVHPAFKGLLDFIETHGKVMFQQEKERKSAKEGKEAPSGKDKDAKEKDNGRAGKAAVTPAKAAPVKASKAEEKKVKAAAAERASQEAAAKEAEESSDDDSTDGDSSTEDE